MFKKSTALIALLAVAPLSQGALFVNTGASPTAGIGPNGADANYVAVSSGPHENAATGNLETVLGVTFAEGGLAGTYDVGVEFTWPDTTDLRVRQSFSRSQNPSGAYSSFFQDWVGLDSRTSNGGNGVGTTMRLTLTGLEANTDFVLTSYHFDTHDQQGTFTTSASGATVFANGRAAGDDSVDVSNFAYDFDVTSDGSGTIVIDYVNVSGSWNSLNGFDLAAVVPEPSSLALIGLGGLLITRRRRG